MTVGGDQTDVPVNSNSALNVNDTTVTIAVNLSIIIVIYFGLVNLVYSIQLQGLMTNNIVSNSITTKMFYSDHQKNRSGEYNITQNNLKQPKATMPGTRAIFDLIGLYHTRPGIAASDHTMEV